MSQQSPVAPPESAKPAKPLAKRASRTGRRIVILLLVAALCGAAFYWWRTQAARSLPAYIAMANGRLEMTRIDIAVKYPGRVTALFVDEGDEVKSGTVLARQDDAETKAQIVQAEAARSKAQAAIAAAQAQVDVHRKSQELAQLDWTQTTNLDKQKIVSSVELQRRRIALDAETAGVAAATAAVAEAHAALDEAVAQIARLKIALDELTVRAPISGRIEYRIIEKDAVLPSGGRIATLLDIDDAYMTVFLAAETASRVHLGDEARVMLAGFDHVLPATVSFVSPEAQFTPKYVETQIEREKLVYRIKLQLPLSVARKYKGALKAGETGDGYVRLDPTRPWPAFLSPKEEGSE